MAEWVCHSCGFKAPLLEGYYWKCPNCGSPLSIQYRLSFEKTSGRTIWERFSGLLPIRPEKYRGEGDTPLIHEKYGSKHLFFKLEYLNPGGSFKDRGAALATYYAWRIGAKTLIDDTSGNTGISLTLFSRLYGIKPIIVMPASAPEGKKKLVEMLGGLIVEVPSRGLGEEKAVQIASETGGFYAAHTWSPFFILGASTIVFEIAEEGVHPDVVIAPVGSGGLFLGLVRGFEILVKMGNMSKMPKFYAVQGYSVQPVQEALKGRVEPGNPSTLADGIMVPNPPRLKEIVEALRKYSGDVILVSNEEIMEAREELWGAGFIVEPTSAAAYAAYKKRASEMSGSNILIILTGSGLKMI